MESTSTRPLSASSVSDVDVTPWSFKKKLCRARTFGFMKDVKQLRPQAARWRVAREHGGNRRQRNLNMKGFATATGCSAQGDGRGCDLALAVLRFSWALPFLRWRSPSNSAVLHALYDNEDAWTIVENGREALCPARRSERRIWHRLRHAQTSRPRPIKTSDNHRRY